MYEPYKNSIEEMNITVYSASSGQVGEVYQEAAKALGRAMAERGHRLVNGAGKMGLMAAVADVCMAAGGEAVGIIPQFMMERGWQHAGMTQLLPTKDMHERKELLAKTGDACIALAGGVGTLEELLEVITWKQLGLYLQPIVILNTNHYYDALLEQLQRAVDEHFMRPMHAQLWAVAQTPEEAVRLCEETPLWDKNLTKFAAL